MYRRYHVYEYICYYDTIFKRVKLIASNMNHMRQKSNRTSAKCHYVISLKVISFNAVLTVTRNLTLSKVL